ncbi:SseB family protein [Leucobacter massiliensis]|uniref:SseB protein N-terminal domain-containing protein n=1 Tax=Leucobacter massiliensis TaxID=1686285 RepID=A0A2S9QMG2_9MICO|nr:SseB family protein [Leucobacter massiliensis]PRI10784.1 hypothetical protein B4915_07745 [Leucobacter massiliensis]
MAIKKLPSTGDAPRSTGVPESLVPGGAADSAGFPWAGRTFEHHETAFAGDDGRAPQAFAEAVERLRGAARAATPHATADALAELAEAHAEALLALSASRVLIPLLAEAGGTGLTPDGRTVDKSQELSIVTVASPDGRTVMPVFSSVGTMRAWHAEARPIPVPGPQAALAAAQEQTELIIVDPGTPEREFGVRRTQLEAVALGERTAPAWADPRVLDAFRASLAGEDRVLGIALLPGDPQARLLAPETDVVLRIAAGLDRAALGGLVGELQQRWARDAVIAARVDSLRVRPVAG